MFKNGEKNNVDFNAYNKFNFYDYNIHQSKIKRIKRTWI